MLNPCPHNAVDGETVVFATTDPRFAFAMTYGLGDMMAACYARNTKGEKEFYLNEIEEGALHLLENSASLYIIDTKVSGKTLA